MIKKIGIITNFEKKNAGKMSKHIADFLKKHRIKIVDNINKSQLVIAIGGDGMVLRTAQAIRKQIPVLPVHLGTLGFLSQINVAQFKNKIEQILKGDFKIENRMMLSARVGKLEFRALNDFVIERRTHRAIVLDIKIGNEKLATYLGDGIIVATPTGSTAYTLAAGGPIVNPLVSCTILTPVSAHTLINRSFVLAENELVKIFPGDDCFLIVDGQEKVPVRSRVPITIKKAPFVFKLVRIGERKFYSAITSLRMK